MNAWAFCMPATAWKWEIAARACLMEEMDRPVVGVGPYLEPPPGGGLVGAVGLGRLAVPLL